MAKRRKAEINSRIKKRQEEIKELRRKINELKNPEWIHEPKKIDIEKTKERVASLTEKLIKTAKRLEIKRRLGITRRKALKQEDMLLLLKDFQEHVINTLIDILDSELKHRGVYSKKEYLRKIAVSIFTMYSIIHKKRFGTKIKGINPLIVEEVSNFSRIMAPKTHNEKSQESPLIKFMIDFETNITFFTFLPIFIKIGMPIERIERFFEMCLKNKNLKAEVLENMLGKHFDVKAKGLLEKITVQIGEDTYFNAIEAVAEIMERKIKKLEEEIAEIERKEKWREEERKRIEEERLRKERNLRIISTQPTSTKQIPKIRESKEKKEPKKISINDRINGYLKKVSGEYKKRLIEFMEALGERKEEIMAKVMEKYPEPSSFAKKPWAEIEREFGVKIRNSNSRRIKAITEDLFSERARKVWMQLEEEAKYYRKQRKISNQGLYVELAQMLNNTKPSAKKYKDLTDIEKKALGFVLLVRLSERGAKGRAPISFIKKLLPEKYAYLFAEDLVKELMKAKLIVFPSDKNQKQKGKKRTYYIVNPEYIGYYHSFLPTK